MKNPNSNARLVIVALIVSMLAACATQRAYQPDTSYQGPVDSYINRAPSVGDTGHVGHVQFVYTPAGWARI
jgi:hypothetical protein